MKPKNLKWISFKPVVRIIFNKHIELTKLLYAPGAWDTFSLDKKFVITERQCVVMHNNELAIRVNKTWLWYYIIYKDSKEEKRI